MSERMQHHRDDEARQLLRAYHQGRCQTPFVPFEMAAIDQSIPQRFAQQVQRHAENIAVVVDGQPWTYTELNALANRIAHAILAHCGSTSEPVALLFAPGLAPIAAILGTLKAGKCYVPLEPRHPLTRTQYIMADAQAKLLLTQTNQLGLARDIVSSPGEIVNIDALPASVSSENPAVAIAPNALAYLMYTSGSTGRPKGVMETHRNVLHHMMRVTNEFEICAADRQTLLRSYSFNGAVRDIFSTLLNGASLYLFNLETAGFTQLAAWLIQADITLYRSVVSSFRSFASLLTDDIAFPHLRVIHIGGEPITHTDVALFQRHFAEHCVLVSGLGITEAGTVRHFYMSKKTVLADPIVPVGYATVGLDVLLLDEQGHRVDGTQPGEIAIKSRYLSPGYWRQPELTRARFLPCTDDHEARLYLTGDLGRLLPDGCLIHLGRKDFQVKIRGQRVEIAEIEAALLAIAGVQEALVVAQDDTEGNPRLIAYYVPADTAALSVTALRQALTVTLPAAMLPWRFVRLSAMPLTPAGKVDRRALPTPSTQRPELDTPLVLPTTPLASTLAAIWSQVLEVEPIGIHDRFLDLGGQSLLATQLVRRIQATFGVNLTIHDVFDAATIVELSNKVLELLLNNTGSDVTL